MQLIRNRFFDTGMLEPWSECEFALEGGVTDENPVFISEYNLKLMGNDCVEQQLQFPALVEDRLLLWLAAGADNVLWENQHSADYGSLVARVNYQDGTFDQSELTYNGLRDRSESDGRPIMGVHNFNVPVIADKYVTSVRLRVHDAGVPWFIGEVRMSGSFAQPPAFLEHRPTKNDLMPMLGQRLYDLENRLEYLYGFIANEQLAAKIKRPKHE